MNRMTPAKATVWIRSRLMHIPCSPALALGGRSFTASSPDEIDRDAERDQGQAGEGVPKSPDEGVYRKKTEERIKRIGVTGYPHVL